MPRKADAVIDPPPPASMEEHQRARLTAAAQEYRTLVNRAAAGETMSEADYTAAEAALEALGLPAAAWARDTAAAREHAALGPKLVEARRHADDAAARLREIAGDAGELARLEKQVRELRAEAYTLQRVVPHRVVGLEQRRAELEALSGHVLWPLDKAVAVAMQRREQQAAERRRREDGVEW